MARTRNRVARRERRAAARATAAEIARGPGSIAGKGQRHNLAPEYWHGNGWQKWLCNACLERASHTPCPDDENYMMAQRDRKDSGWNIWLFPKVIVLPIRARNSKKKVRRPCLFLLPHRVVATGRYICPEHGLQTHQQVRKHYLADDAYGQIFVSVLYGSDGE